MLETTVESIRDPLVEYWNQFVDYLPQLIGAIIVLLVGLVLASVIGGIVSKVISLGEEDRNVKSFLARWDIRLKLSGFVSKFVWWAVFLVFVSASVDILDIPVLTTTLATLVGYLPQLFAAAVVATVVLYGARIVRSLVEGALVGVGFKQSGVVGGIVYVALLVFGLTLAAAQLGVDTNLLVANITVVIAGIMLALALAFGLGGREHAARVLDRLEKNNVKPTVKAKK